MSFPMKIRYGETPTTVWRSSEDTIKITKLVEPEHDFRLRCYKMIKSTWADHPLTAIDCDDDEVRKCFMDLLRGKVLPNSMEHLIFSFLFEGLTLVEVTHMLRHRTMFSVHAQCTADRFLHHDACFIPSSIEQSEFANEYKELSDKCKDLYARMVDSQQISLLDARYILPRNHLYFYYFSMNLKDALAFINQRKCTQVQPELDNIIAHSLFEHIAQTIPEIREVVSLDCNASCFYCKAPDGDNSRLFAPDAVHAKYSRPGMQTLYAKRRQEMGVAFNPQEHS